MKYDKITFKTKNGKSLSGIKIDNKVTFVDGTFFLSGNNTEKAVESAFHSCAGIAVDKNKAKFKGMNAHDILGELGYNDSVKLKYYKNEDLTITVSFINGWE